MPDNHINSSNEILLHTSADNDSMLAQQVQQQAKQIAELTWHLQQKEQELAALHNQTSLIHELTHKLHTTETTMQTAFTQAQAKTRLIDELSSKLKQQERQMISASEQAQLIDELTTKLLEVEIKLAAASLQGKHIAAQNVVKTHVIAGMALGLLPAPLFDIAALSAVQLNLLRSLCRHYAVAFDEQMGKGIVSSLASGSLPVLTVLGLSSFAKLIPGFGTIGGGISMTVLAGSTIYATGQVFIRHFESGGTLQNFDSKHWQAFFKQQLEEGKALVKGKLDATSLHANAQPQPNQATRL